VPYVLNSNKRLMEYLQEQENLRRGKRRREGMAAIPPPKNMDLLMPAVSLVVGDKA
jgi:hypothetical protein